MPDVRVSKTAGALPSPTAGAAAIPRSEWYTIAVIVLTATTLRFVAPGRLAVEHFDEGVYASNLWFDETHGFGYPDRFLYAPPLLPALIEWGLIFLGPRDWVPMLPGMVLGTATVVGVWWLGRQWYGGTVGCLAAFLVACSDYHILFSRTALTDAPMACFLVLGLACAWRGMLVRRFRWIVFGGTLLGLAWWTKYNGWLGAAAVVAGTAAASAERSVATLLRRWRGKNPAAGGGPGSGQTSWELKAVALLVLVCVVVWSPVWWSLQPIGGYRRVAENHRRYWLAAAEESTDAEPMSPVAVWVSNARRQLRMQRYLEGVPSWAALVAMLVALASWIRRAPLNCPTLCYVDALRAVRPTGGPELASALDDLVPSFLRVRRVVAVAVMAGFLSLGALMVYGGATTVCWALAVGGLATAAVRPSVVTPDDSTADTLIRRRAFWWHAIWWAGLAGATPCYYPYPRIAMPLMIATWIAAAAGISLLIRLGVQIVVSEGLEATFGRDAAPPSSSPWRAMVLAKIAMLAALVAVAAATQGVPLRSAGSAVAWPVRTGLRDAVRITEAAISEEVSRRSGLETHWAAYVFAVPAAVYHLSADGFVAQPTADLRFIDDREHLRRAAIFLVTGEQTERLAEWTDADPQRRGRLERIAEVPYRASDVVVLDEAPPRRAEERRTRVLRVWRVRP